MLVLQIAERELAVLRERLGLPEDSCSIRNVVALGAGNALHVRIDSTNTTAIFAGFGTRGVTVEKLATRLAHEVERYLGANVAVEGLDLDRLRSIVVTGDLKHLTLIATRVPLTDLR